MGDVINVKSLCGLSTEASTSTEDLAGTEIEYIVYRKRKGVTDMVCSSIVNFHTRFHIKSRPITIPKLVPSTMW